MESVRQMKAGRAAPVAVSRETAVRQEAGLSQVQFAALLGVSPRTLRGWEQGRREPTGAARTLLRVAERHPEVLWELAA